MCNSINLGHENKHKIHIHREVISGRSPERAHGGPARLRVHRQREPGQPAPLVQLDPQAEGGLQLGRHLERNWNHGVPELHKTSLGDI